MKVRINNGAPSAARRRALKKECIREFDELLSKFNRQVVLQVLYILRFDFGFGQERLNKFADKLNAMQITTVEKYEVKDDDVPNICEMKLRDSGIEVDRFFD